MNRADYLGSSDAKDIVSLEPYGCRRSMVFRKAGVPVDDAERQAVRFSDDEGPVARGIELEEKVRGRIRKKIGPCWKWLGPTAAALMPHRPPVPAWLSATPDGIVGPLDEAEAASLGALCRITITDKIKALVRSAGLLEAKTVSQGIFWQIAKGGPRPDHVLQVQHQMAATAAPWAVIAYLNADNWKWLYFFIERDEAWERESYLPAAYEVWNQITRAKAGIDLGASPDTWEPFLPARLAEGAKQCRTCSHRRTCWGSAYLRVMEIPVDGDALNMDGDPAWAVAAGDLLAAREILADAEAIKEEAEEKIKAMLGDRTCAEGAGLKVYYKPQTSKRLDTTALKRDLPEIAAKYTKETASRPLRTYSV